MKGSTDIVKSNQQNSTGSCTIQTERCAALKPSRPASSLLPSPRIKNSYKY